MSHSLVIFEPSGRVLFQTNKRTSPFNELIHSIVNETYVGLSPTFFTTVALQKRFYALKKEYVYGAIYFDAVTTVDNDKVKQCLSDALKIYARVSADGESEKMHNLIEHQVDQLMRMQTEGHVETTPAEAASGVSKEKTTTATKKKQTKKMRKWIDGELVEVDATDNAALDYSSPAVEGETKEYNAELLNVDNSTFSKKDNLVLVNELNEILDSDDDENEDEESGSGRGFGASFFTKLSSYLGGAADIDEVSKKFVDLLVSKNVAPATAQTVIERIKQKINKKSVTAGAFKQQLTEELTKILTPNVSTDLLYDIKENSNTAGSRPYVISVVGVNGVGKSTNLAKLAYWFLQNDLSVLICACDTFRSGAVEQLRVHVNNLQRLNSGSSGPSKVELFEKGYGGGDHVVNTAKLAIQHAQELGYHVVLIDTAGRTHSNAKLMAPLKKFGDAADPNKIIMVGEALVGTDSVEQAVNFNNAFGNRRGLDFFIISKVDTVGDLVGTMINMVVATNMPILFVGTGQTYTDIKKLSVKQVVRMLTN